MTYALLLMLAMQYNPCPFECGPVRDARDLTPAQLASFPPDVNVVQPNAPGVYLTMPYFVWNPTPIEATFLGPEIVDGRKIYKIDTKPDWTCRVVFINVPDYPTAFTVACIKAEPKP